MRLAAVMTALMLLIGGGAMAQDRATPVQTDAVVRAPVARTVPVLGRMVPRRSGAVAARVAGPLARMRVEVGDQVRQGAVLAELVDDRLNWLRDLRAAERIEAEAKLAGAEAQLRQVEAELARLERLRGSAAFNRSRYEDQVHEVARLEGARAEAQARLKRAEAQLAEAEWDLDHAEVLAPYDGVVSARHLSAGAYVNRGEAVVDLIDHTTLEIEADVPADRLAGLVPGVDVEVTFAGGQDHIAMVRAVVPYENAKTRTRPVRLVPAPVDRTLAINESVTVHVPAGPARSVLSVAKDAVLAGAEGHRVWVVGDDGTVQPRPIRVGEGFNGRFEVISGLEPGERVVVRGNERLRPGQKVTEGAS